jgi:hypothetical protein
MDGGWMNGWRKWVDAWIDSRISINMESNAKSVDLEWWSCLASVTQILSF